MTDVRSVGMYSIPRHIKLVKLNYGAYIIYMHSSILMQVRTIRQASDNEYVWYSTENHFVATMIVLS